ncbi:MAG: DegT/DnrJ/EryC1/StrS family aminotransferase [Magnetococcales bacterium]|nr:DegT/DnrJ/EryC1/StrS family aminotransferase [Magnetococcales bacterium]
MAFSLPHLPKARSRLYTRLDGYLRILWESLTGHRLKGEEDLAKWVEALCGQIGSPYGVDMPMARVGIYAAVQALIRPGQKVALSPYTIADVINMVVCAGGVPLFVDIDRATCNIDPSALEEALRRHPDVGAVLVTHFYGLACDMPRIQEICRNRGVPLIEDAAQAFGTRLAGRSVGSFGDVGIFSFGLYKGVNTFYGGLLVTPHRGLYERVREQRREWPWQPQGAFLGLVAKAVVTDVLTHPLLYGMFTFYLFRYAYQRKIAWLNKHLSFDIDPQLKTVLPEGYAVRYTPLQARLGLAQLPGVAADLAARVRTAQRYHRGLQDIGELILPPWREDGSHGYSYYPVQYEDREALVSFALSRGVDLAESHHKNCAALPCFAPYAGECPSAARTARSLIYLPTYPGYDVQEVERVIRVIRAFFGRA